MSRGITDVVVYYSLAILITLVVLFSSIVFKLPMGPGIGYGGFVGVGFLGIGCLWGLVGGAWLIFKGGSDRLKGQVWCHLFIVMVFAILLLNLPKF